MAKHTRRPSYFSENIVSGEPENSFMNYFPRMGLILPMRPYFQDALTQEHVTTLLIKKASAVFLQHRSKCHSLNKTSYLQDVHLKTLLQTKSRNANKLGYCSEANPSVLSGLASRPTLSCPSGLHRLPDTPVGSLAAHLLLLLLGSS